MYLDRIISKSISIPTIGFTDITKDIGILKEKAEIPTLVVGKSLAIEAFGAENVKVLDKKLAENVYWTYSKGERRNEFDKDVEKFNKLVISNALSSISYHYFNVFTEKYSNTKWLLKFIMNKKPKTVFWTDKHAYIYANGNVIGVSLENIEYIGINRDKIFNLIKRNKSISICFNDDFIPNYTKRFINGDKRIVPYLYFIKNA